MVYEWTAAELYELVKDLPEGARPDCIHWYGDGVFTGDSIGAIDGDNLEPLVSVDLAVLAHTAALVEWLGQQWYTVHIYGPVSKGYAVSQEDGLGVSYEGPTLLHALVAAAKEVGK